MSENNTKITYKCPAKINLFLKIVGYKNGYHLLESVLKKIDLYDELTIKKTTTNLKINITGPYKNKLNPKDNLFTEILTYFTSNFQISPTLEITLEKNIPVSAGLGGGSSNAAYFMLALNKLFNLNLNQKNLIDLSFNFGSDIAFFLQNSNYALIRNRGQIETPIKTTSPFPKTLLINPNKELLTKSVFINYQKSKKPFSKKLNTPNIINQPPTTLLTLNNDLEPTAKTLLPEITQILKTLKQQNAQITKLSGSGPTCFATFKTNQDLKNCQTHFKKTHPTYFTHPC